MEDPEKQVERVGTVDGKPWAVVTMLATLPHRWLEPDWKQGGYTQYPTNAWVYEKSPGRFVVRLLTTHWRPHAPWDQKDMKAVEYTVKLTAPRLRTWRSTATAVAVLAVNKLFSGRPFQRGKALFIERIHAVFNDRQLIAHVIGRCFTNQSTQPL